MQKSVTFVYTNNELSQREIKEISSFTITMKRNKITLGDKRPVLGKL